MNATAISTCTLGSLLALALLGGADSKDLDPHLEPLRPLLGKTWRGELKATAPEKGTVDVARWERALNGKAVRILHSINDGIYGGETLIFWDAEKKEVVSYYFTTSGFYTVGTFAFTEGKVKTHEKVSGSAGGIAEVRATSELLPDGGFHVRSEHLKDGAWSAGHEVTYREDPKAEVKFR